MAKFQKGQSGNPGGRPKGKSITALLEKYLKGKDGEIEGKTRKQALIEKLTEMGLDGNMIALKYIIDRIDGKPTEHVKAEVKQKTYEITPAPELEEKDEQAN